MDTTSSRRQVLGVIATGLAGIALASCGATTPASSGPAATSVSSSSAAPATTQHSSASSIQAAQSSSATATATSAPATTLTTRATTTTVTTKATAGAVTGKATPTPVHSSLAARSGKATIEVWHIYGVPPTRPVFLGLLQDFNQQTGIGIAETASLGNDIFNVAKFTAATAAGTPPDVYNNTGSIIFGGRGMLLPLDAYIARDKVPFNTKDFFYAMVYLSQFEGKTYGLPFQTGSFALFWDKNAFAQAGLQPPQTWSALKTATQRLLKQQPDNSLQRVGFDPLFGQSVAGGALWSWMAQAGPNGYPFIDYNQHPPKARFATPEAIKAYDFVASLVDLNGGANTLRAFEKTYAQSEPFTAGKFASMIQGGYYVATMEHAKPGVQYDKDYGIVAQPVADGVNKKVTMAGGWDMSIPTDAKHKEEAWTFTKWFAEDPQMLRWCRDTDTIPAKVSVGANAAFGQMPTKFFVDLMQVALPIPAGPWTTTPTYTMASALNDIISKKHSVEDALKQANDQYQNAINSFYQNRT